MNSFTYTYEYLVDADDVQALVDGHKRVGGEEDGDEHCCLHPHNHQRALVHLLAEEEQTSGPVVPLDSIRTFVVLYSYVGLDN